MSIIHYIRKICYQIPFLKKKSRKLSLLKTKVLLKTNPKYVANNTYKSVFYKDVNWKNPINLIEKILWLQLFSDTSLWTKCSDKYLVRDYLAQRDCTTVLNTLYGKWDTPDQIDWAKLPDRFVIKTNNSCGQVIIVKNKAELNIPQVEKQLSQWLESDYGYHTAQLHYTKIKPCIIAEKLLETEIQTDKSLVDYKIWCFHGVPECILVVYNRTKNDYLLSSYDLEWNNISDITFNKANPHFSGQEVTKPKSLDRMIEVAKKLSAGIPQVRVDFYDINGEAVFGEMTFTTGFGYYSEEYYNYLGSKIDLRKAKSK